MLKYVYLNGFYNQNKVFNLHLNMFLMLI